VSAVEGSEREQEIMAGLRHAQGFLRSELARRIDLRSFPKLRFQWDATFERAEHMERLFASLEQEKSSNPPAEVDADQEYEGTEEEEADGEE
jgi:ribosome-binding factor A